MGRYVITAPVIPHSRNHRTDNLHRKLQFNDADKSPCNPAGIPPLLPQTASIPSRAENWDFEFPGRCDPPPAADRIIFPPIGTRRSEVTNRGDSTDHEKSPWLPRDSRAG